MAYSISEFYRYGKVTFEVSFPTLVPGVVVAVILIGGYLPQCVLGEYCDNRDNGSRWTR
jgi:hypothetical protein